SELSGQAREHAWAFRGMLGADDAALPVPARPGPLRPRPLARRAGAVAAVRPVLRGALDLVPRLDDIRGGAADAVPPAADPAGPPARERQAQRGGPEAAVRPAARGDARRAPPAGAGCAVRDVAHRRLRVRWQAVYLGARPLGAGLAGAHVGRPQRRPQLD